MASASTLSKRSSTNPQSTSWPRLAIEVRARTTELGRSFVLIGECDLNAPRFVQPTNSGGYGLDAQWSDDFHYALHAALTGERAGYYRDFGPLSSIADALTHGFVFRGQYSSYRGRRQGADPHGIPHSRFVVYSQNHDQVGNRPRGDRLSSIVSDDRQRLAAALTLLSPFTPLLFMGEEWGERTPFRYFIDHQEAHLREAVAQGRRREYRAFGWDESDSVDPSEPLAFKASKLDWHARGTASGQALVAYYRDLIRMRRQYRGEIRVEFDEIHRWLILWRGSLGAVCNFGNHEVTIPLSPSIPLLGKENILSSSNSSVTLKPGAVVVVDAKTAKPPVAHPKLQPDRF